MWSYCVLIHLNYVLFDVFLISLEQDIFILTTKTLVCLSVSLYITPRTRFIKLHKNLLYFVDLASRYNSVNNQLDAIFLFQCFYFTSLHVSSNPVLIIREINWFSWWWALGFSKHVEVIYIHWKRKIASSWLLTVLQINLSDS